MSALRRGSSTGGAAGTGMRSPVSWALLGLVIERPGYGHEFVQRFEETYGDALPLSSTSQIYVALDSLLGRSLIEEIAPSEAGAAAARQPRPHYRATDEGERAYQEWLVAEARDERRRSRLFTVQLAMLAPPSAIAVIERYEQECLREGTALHTASGSDQTSGDPERLADRLVGEQERLDVGAKLSWLEYARREIEELAARRPPRA